MYPTRIYHTDSVDCSEFMKPAMEGSGRTLEEAVEFCHPGRDGQVNGLVAKVNDKATEHSRVDLVDGEKQRALPWR
jgi:hypothetical protein